ncbi:MAG: hypothetical protein ACK56W_18260 [Pirellula sp.]|jgi:hypothetical protein|nr:hypothetical protein [Pirellula sp.]
MKMNASPTLGGFSFQILLNSFLPQITIWSLAILMAACGSVVSFAGDDSKSGLERPEWQRFADSEFRAACQSALQTLCLELIQTHQKEPNLPANSNLLVELAFLLESTDGKIPTKLPDHPATIDYVKSRKAAVIEWNKVYRSKGRDLPSAALDAEKKLQEAFRDQMDVTLPQTTSGAVSSASESKTETDGMSVGGDTNAEDRKSENRPAESTIKNYVNLIKEVHKFETTTASGETTAERQASALVLKRATYAFIEKQPDYFLTFPIKDVTARDKGLEFTVDAPLEFEQIQKELGQELLLISETDTIHTQVPSIVKKWKSIKPGDLLRVRFKIGVIGLNTESKSSGKHLIRSVVKFSATNSTANQYKQQGAKLLPFVEKTLIELQVTKPSTKAPAP